MKVIVSVSKLSKFYKKKEMKKLDPEIWGRIPIELYKDIKDIFLENIRKAQMGRPSVKIRICIDVFNYISFYFGLH